MIDPTVSKSTTVQTDAAADVADRRDLRGRDPDFQGVFDGQDQVEMREAVPSFNAFG